MSKWVHADVLDNGPAYIKNNCNKVCVLSSYAEGDNYATVTAAILAEAAMASTDFTLANSGAGPVYNRAMTTASGKQDTAANVSGTASHIAFVDTVASKVLWVTDETSGQSIPAGNPVTFPSLVYTAKQPVAP